MRVCESCGGLKAHARLYHGQRILVICDACHGTGLISLGHETAARHAQLREEAYARAIREGWYEETWEPVKDGGTKLALKVLRRIGPAELVEVDRGEVA